MAVDLLQLLKDQVVGDLASQGSKILNEPQSKLESGLGNIFPALLGSMVDKTGDSGFVDKIFDLVSNADSSILGDIGGALSGQDNQNKLLNQGGGILNLLLGDKLGKLTNTIGSLAGLKSSSSSSLLKMAAPFLISMIGKNLTGGKSGLLSMLSGQKSSVSRALPSALTSLLSLGGLGDAAKNVGSTVSATAGKAGSAARDTAKNVGSTVNRGRKSGGGGFFKWLLPLLLLALLGWFLMRQCGDDMKKTGSKVGDKMGEVTDKAGDMAGDAVDKVGDAAKKGGETVAGAAKWGKDELKNLFGKVDKEELAKLKDVKFTDGSAGDQMMKYIEGGFDGDPLFRFLNLNFQTGSATISDGSMDELKNVVSVLKAYPGVRISVEGHTDNVGNAESNLALSEKRAEAAKTWLATNGVAANRIESKGYGQTKPLATNDTDAGRAQNRRTEIRIIK